MAITTVVENISQHRLLFYIPILLLLASAVYITFTIIYNRFFHSLSKFPGPFTASFTNAWKQYHVAAGNLEHVILDSHRKYGKIVRIGPNHLDISDGPAVKGIYGSGRDFPKRYANLTYFRIRNPYSID